MGADDNESGGRLMRVLEHNSRDIQIVTFCNSFQLVVWVLSVDEVLARKRSKFGGAKLT